MVQTALQINKDGSITLKKIITIRKFKQRHCKWCNTKFNPNYPHQLYCTCDCSYYAKLEYANKRKRKYRKRYKGIINETDTNLGSGNLGEHMASNFDDEYNKILSEFKFLKLK